LRNAHQNCPQIASAAGLQLLINTYMALGPRYAMGIGFAEGMNYHQVLSTIDLMASTKIYWFAWHWASIWSV
jgi:hypothetical protein